MSGLGTLPHAVTPFVGRSLDLQALADLVADPDARLVTLTGPAGVGKTRLAVEVARTVRAKTTDGVVWVPVAHVRDPALVLPALLTALGSGSSGARDAEDVVADLVADRPVLLVLDNLEQVLAVGPVLARLLERCLALRVLATSRHPLQVRPERTYPVAPLQVGGADADAERFLLARLQAVDPRQDWTADPTVLADICGRLDGVPLALELVAARARVLPLAAIRDALEHRLPLLTRGGADAPDRHRTMSAALAWSTQLLAPDSALLFRRLGVFLGGADLDAVAVLVADVSLTLLDAVDDLVAHSLVTCDADGRLRMLEVVREWALEELARAAEVDVATEHHLRWCLALAEEAAEHLAGPEQLRWLDRLERERANLTAAVRAALSASDGDRAVRLCLALRFLWYVRGPLAEGQTAFAAALSLPGASERHRVLGQVEAAALARHAGDLEVADALTDQALTTARTLGEQTVLGTALLQRGFVLHVLGHYAAAREALEECLTLRQTAGDRLGTARALHHLGLVAHLGDGDLAVAWELQVRALALFRELGHSRQVVAGLIGMADIARARHDPARARALRADALRLLADLQDLPLLSYALHGAATSALEEGQPSRAVRLLGAAEGVDRVCGAPPWPAVQAGARALLARATSTLGEPRVAALRQAGAALSPEAAAELALTDTDTGPLTAREHQIAELVAHGHTNRAIAQQLVISERTVDGHVARILAKLQLTSRTQIAVWAATR